MLLEQVNRKVIKPYYALQHHPHEPHKDFPINDDMLQYIQRSILRIDGYNAELYLSYESFVAEVKRIKTSFINPATRPQRATMISSHTGSYHTQHDLATRGLFNMEMSCVDLLVVLDSLLTLFSNELQQKSRILSLYLEILNNAMHFLMGKLYPDRNEDEMGRESNSYTLRTSSQSSDGSSCYFTPDLQANSNLIELSLLLERYPWLNTYAVEKNMGDTPQQRYFYNNVDDNKNNNEDKDYNNNNHDDTMTNNNKNIHTDPPAVPTYHFNIMSSLQTVLTSIDVGGVVHLFDSRPGYDHTQYTRFAEAIKNSQFAAQFALTTHNNME